MDQRLTPPFFDTAAMRDTGSFADHVTLGSTGGFSQMGVVEDITKRRWEVWDARGIPTVTRRAFQEAMTLPTAPVYVAYTSQALDTPGVEAVIQPGAAPVMGQLPEEGVLRTIFDAVPTECSWDPTAPGCASMPRSADRPPNNRLNPPVGPVTGLAVARPGPVPPAG